MAVANSPIEWTDATWSPVTGCSKVSPGCAHCYAETIAMRFWKTQYANVPDGNGGERPRVFEDVQCHEDRLDAPLRWRKPRRVFVNSMSDLFHEDVETEFIARVYAVMALAHWHTFQVLTKRPERRKTLLNDSEFRAEVEVWIAMMTERIDEDGPDERPPALRWDSTDRRTDDARATAPDVCGDDWPLQNVWEGVSVENRHWKSRVIPHLVSTPAAVRFVSVEPLLEDLGDISDWFPREREVSQTQSVWIDGVNLVITGGESGSRARPAHPDWFRSLRDQCLAAGVAYFHKQNGGWTPGSVVGCDERVMLTDGRALTMSEYLKAFSQTPAQLNPTIIAKVGKKAAGRLLDGREWNEFPAARREAGR